MSFANHVPAEELNRRTAAFQEHLAQNGLDGALIMQSADLYYFTGIFQNCYLFIPSSGAPLLMVRRSTDRVAESSAVSQTTTVKSLKQVPSVLAEFGYDNFKSLGLEMDVIAAATYLNLQKLFPDVKWQDCSRFIKQIRSVKSSYELELLKETGAMMHKVFASVPGFLRPGTGEHELAGELEARFRKEGHHGLVRLRGFNNDFHYGLLLSGPSGAVPSFFDGPLGGSGLNPTFPIGPGWRTVGTDEPVLIDYVGTRNGYLVDITRLFVTGKLNSRLEKAHNVALEIQQELIETVQPGITGNQLYDRAYDIAVKYGLQDYFMGAREKVPFIGHGVGLELNELPVIARGLETPLEEGMVIALEPKFVFPGEGAVGIENSFILTSRGLQRLCDYTDEPVTVPRD